MRDALVGAYFIMIRCNCAISSTHLPSPVWIPIIVLGNIRKRTGCIAMENTASNLRISIGVRQISYLLPALILTTIIPGHTPIPTLKDRVYLKVIILQLVDDRLPQITKLMEEEGIHAVLLQADFHFNPPTVTLTNAVTSPTPSGVTINGWTDTKSRWIRLLREHGTVQGRVLCVGVCPRGQITMPVMHAVDVTSMTIVG